MGRGTLQSRASGQGLLFGPRRPRPVLPPAKLERALRLIELTGHELDHSFGVDRVEQVGADLLHLAEELGLDYQKHNQGSANDQQIRTLRSARLACLYELNAEQESGLRPWTRQDLQRFAPQTSKIGSAQRALNRAQTLHRARGSLDALGLDLGEAGVREALASLFRLGHACEWDDAALREAVLGRYLKDRGRWQRA